MPDGRIPMNHDYVDPSFARSEWYSEAYSYGSGTGWNGGPVDGVHAGVSLTPPDAGWDPVEELAYLMQEAVPAEQTARVPPPRSEPSSGVDFTDPMEGLAQITAQLPPTRGSSAGHRKMRGRKLRRKWLQTGSFVIVALVAVMVAMVSVFGGMVAYAPLQNITSGTGAEWSRRGLFSCTAPGRWPLSPSSGLPCISAGQCTHGSSFCSSPPLR